MRNRVRVSRASLRQRLAPRSWSATALSAGGRGLVEPLPGLFGMAEAMVGHRKEEPAVDGRRALVWRKLLSLGKPYEGLCEPGRAR